MIGTPTALSQVVRQTAKPKKRSNIMSSTTIAALPALAALQQSAAKVMRRGQALRFRFRRSDIASIPGIQQLIDLGITVRVYSGGLIHDLTAGTVRATPVVRHHLTVEVLAVA